MGACIQDSLILASLNSRLESDEGENEEEGFSGCSARVSEVLVACASVLDSGSRSESSARVPHRGIIC